MDGQSLQSLALRAQKDRIDKVPGSELGFYWNENNLKRGIRAEGKAGIRQELERTSGAEAVGMERTVSTGERWLCADCPKKKETPSDKG